MADIDVDKFLISYAVNTDLVEKRLERFKDEVRNFRTKRGRQARSFFRSTRGQRISKNNFAGEFINFLEKDYFKKLDAIIENLSAHPSSHLGQTMRESAEEVRENVLQRVQKTFKSSRRLVGAINDNGQIQLAYNNSDKQISVGVGNRDILDKWTSIFITNTGKPYDPPAEYNTTSWWTWQEFTGTGPKTHFRDHLSFWAVMKFYGFGGFNPRPIWTQGLTGNIAGYFKEDQDVINNLTRRVGNAILAGINSKL